MTALSLRRLWTIYKKNPHRRWRDEQAGSDPGAAFLLQRRGGVLKVLAYMIEQGEQDEMLRVIERHGRQIDRIQELRPRARRH